jgi:acetyl/propionyl-CoA carboxylase alpha subunit
VIRTLLIANRAEIACRILSTCARLGIRGVVVYSEADADSLAVAMADEAVLIGPAPASRSYLDIAAVMQAAQRCGADAVHPGYGFLAENAELARRVQQAGLTFVGPDPDVIERMGSKVAARQVCARVGVPTVPGSQALDDRGLLAWAEEHGYPVMLKASAGGGGKGMRRVFDRAGLESAVVSARREAEKAFGSGELYLERALLRPRHLEVQVACDSHGGQVHLGVRECSLQRRHQKIVEECPPAQAPPQLLDALTASALKLVREVGYTSLGTVEFLASGNEYYFLEMNTRLQVEHPVTEAVTGLDLVELQISIAEGRALPLAQDQVAFAGHAMEARLTCEDPAAGFLPATGTVLHWSPCSRARVDSGLESGAVVSPHYDSMVAKVICWGQDRAAALRRLESSLRRTVLLGVRSNLDFLLRLLQEETVRSGALSTELVESLEYAAPAVTRRQLLAAAAARSKAEGRSESRSPLGAFPLDVAFEGQPRVRLQGELMEVDGASHRVRLGAGSLTVDGHRFPISVAHQDQRWWVHTPDGTACLLALPRHPVPRQAGAGNSLRAPMPGSVVEILVSPGQLVLVGQPLVKLEAMKMEHLICAPREATVQAVPYAVGDQVEAGVELVQLA